MSLINVSNLEFKYEEKNLFNKLNFRILPFEHIVLLGKNGCGKSTFLKLLDKALLPDNGSIEYLPKIKIAYLDQHLEINKSISINEYLYESFSSMFIIYQKIQKIYEDLTFNLDNYDVKLERALAMTETLERDGFYEIENSLKSILFGLGLQDLDLSKDLTLISGGQRAKIFLAKILLENPDLILLDEPTNFLDKEHVTWLAKYLKSFKGSFLVVSHNYEFVKDIAEIIYELENGNLEKYKGGLDFYLLEKDKRKEEYSKKYESQQREIENLKNYIKENITRSSTSKMAKSRRKKLEKIDILSKPLTDKKITFDFPFSKATYLDALVVKDLIIGYEKPILKPINFKVERGEKIVIAGKNGVGKTTLIKSILGIISYFSGEVNFCDNADILYYSQEFDFTFEETPFSYVSNLFPTMNNEMIRRVLSFLGINRDLTFRKLKELSGGEQSKVRFAELIVKKSNILILDEPTNHLDQNAKKSLLEGINKYPGTIILVSHEKEFYETLNARVINL